MWDSLFNLRDYTGTEHALFAIGCLMWVFVYFIVIHNFRKKDFVEIPMIAICANFAWEFLWSWVYMTDMGSLYVWGYRIWFFLDCFILYAIFRYGYKQLMSMPKASHPYLLIGGLTASFFILYFYIGRYDYPLSHMGAYSGYVLNVLMSALYISLFLRMKNPGIFSLPAAWLKGIGTLLISFFCILHFNDWFLISMCIVTAALDAAYISIFYNYKNETRAE
ncbi:MAG TPA: hypothetical protein VJ917_04185 [Saprospiraceae bacterium]|nr:hypothetical protein [Saprospiraceae bacterium]